MSSASFFQTASQSLVRFSPEKQINMSSAHGPLQTVAFLWRCYSFFTVTVTHLTSTISLQLSGQSPSKTGTLVVPKRSCSCPEESPSLTGTSCNTVTPRLVYPSVSLACFNSQHLISSWPVLRLWQNLLMCPVIKAPPTPCHLVWHPVYCITAQ